MKRPVSFHAMAEQELNDAASYYNASRPGLGQSFLDEVERAVTQILEYPKAAPLVNRTVRKKLVRRFPYGCGSRPRTTTASTRARGLALPLGTAPYPADAQEGPACMGHRPALARPVRPGQGPRGAAAHDGSAPALGRHPHGGSAVCADHARNEHRDPASRTGARMQTARPRRRVGGGVAPRATTPRPRVGTTSAVDRARWTTRSAGPTRSSPGAIGTAWPGQPRLLGPRPRRPPAWQRRYGARRASARPTSAAQDGIANAHPRRLRGRTAWRGAGALRTLAQR